MASSTASAAKPGLLINRNYALLWLGQTISVHGDVIFTITLSLLIAFQLAKGQSWAPLAASGVFIASSLPSLFIRPLAGVFVDRWDKRATMLWNDAIRAMLISALVFITGIVPVPLFPGNQLPLEWRLGILYAVIFLASTAAQFFNPALLALTGDIVPEAQRARAFGLDYFSNSLALVIGPPIAAVLFLSGPQWALLLNALSFILSFLLIVPIHPPAITSQLATDENRNARREFMQGVRFFVRNAALRTLTISICIGVLGFGALNALNVFFVQRRLHGDEQTFATLFACSGVGTILGALIAGRIIERLGANRVFGLAILLMGSIVMVLTQVTLIPIAIGFTFILGMLEACLNVTLGPILLQATPRELVGRVSSIFQPLYSATALISVAIAGYLAGNVFVGLHERVAWFNFDAITTVFTICGGLGAIAGLYALLNAGKLAIAAPTAESSKAAAQ